MTDTKVTKWPYRVTKHIIEEVAKECGISTETALGVHLTMLKLTKWTDPEAEKLAKIIIAEIHRDFPSMSN